MAVEVTEGDGASKRQSVRIGDMNRVENIAYEGLGSLDISYDAMMAFEKPSNAVFQPLEYRSTNCCICIAVADHALSGATNVVDLGSGVVCYCLPGSDPPSVSISTAPAVWHIDTAPSMPRIRFRARLNNIEHPRNPLFWWKLEMTFDERYRQTYTHTRYGATTTAAWSPSWSRLLAGANSMTVSVTVFVNDLTLTASRSGYQIHGENPTQAQIFSIATMLEHKAIAWQESWHKQFGESYTDTPYTGIALPLYGAPDGWGLMHEDPLPSERHLWDWRKNLSDGIDHLEGNYTEAFNYLRTWYKEDSEDPDTRWTWNPTKDTLEVWNDAFARYNTGNTIFSANGNGGRRNCSRNQTGCNYSDAVRGHIKDRPWSNY